MNFTKKKKKNKGLRVYFTFQQSMKVWNLFIEKHEDF